MSDDLLEHNSFWHWYPLQVATIRFHRFRSSLNYFSVRTRHDLLTAAYASTPRLFRWFGFSLPRRRFRFRHPHNDDAHRINAELDRAAKVWPFSFNECSLALRQGYVLVRDGEPRELIIVRTG